MKCSRSRFRIGLAVFFLGLNFLPFTATALLGGPEDQIIPYKEDVSRSCTKSLEGRHYNLQSLDCVGGPGQCGLTD